MEEEVSNNGGPWRARMNSRAPRQKEKKKKKEEDVDVVLHHNVPIFTGLGWCLIVNWDFAGAVDWIPFLLSTNDFYWD